MKKLFSIILAGALFATLLTGCGSSGTTTEGNGELTGEITLIGSTSMEKLSNSLTEVFMQKYPGVIATTQFTGSSAGIEAVINKTADIGNSSRPLKESEKSSNLAENTVAIDGIALIVDPENTVTDLTLEQIKSIFKGEITNWSEVGGTDMAIVVIGREAGSGTRGAFESILDITDLCAYAQEIDSNGAIVGKVETIPGAIGNVSLDVVHNSTAKAISIDGIAPTTETILSGEYPIARPLFMLTNGAISEQREEVQTFFEFIKSNEGKELIEKIGLVPSE